MIGISKLYCGAAGASDSLRYSAGGRKPVIVFNCTRRCNLRCVHCYSRSSDRMYEGELTTAEAKMFIRDAAGYGAPVILFSGGEPLMRPDIFDLIGLAAGAGLRAAISTNGTLITDGVARRLKELGLSYAGISLDGLDAVNNGFRGSGDAFRRALRGIRSCKSGGIETGIRFTMTKRNFGEIPGIFGLAKREGISRICFYHLVYAGRGAELAGEDLSHEEARRALDQIIDLTAALHSEGHPAEVFTVDNHADGVYLYLRMLRERSGRAGDVLRLLERSGGNSSGVGIACVSWNGDVHPDQFWRHLVLGNVKERGFGDIWTDEGNEMLVKLKDKKRHVKGRCASCRWLSICGGNLRVRAEAAGGDVWGGDPACYLTEGEIGDR
jgi:radical SAM protein with 4Fe4S-binding SPASM domain